MATTPTYALRYLSLGDPPDIAALGEHLGEDVEAQIARLDALIATLTPVTAWADYTPSMTNLGSGAFSSVFGRWKRIAIKTVAFHCQWTVGTAGSGSGVCGFALPTAPRRIDRQTFAGHSQDNDALLQAVSFASGSGLIVDRIRSMTPTTSADMTGADLNNGRIITFSGVYEEA